MAAAKSPCGGVVAVVLSKPLPASAIVKEVSVLAVYCIFSFPTRMVPVSGKPAVDPTFKAAVPAETSGLLLVIAADTLVFLNFSCT